MKVKRLPAKALSGSYRCSGLQSTCAEPVNEEGALGSVRHAKKGQLVKTGGEKSTRQPVEAKEKFSTEGP